MDRIAREEAYKEFRKQKEAEEEREKRQKEKEKMLAQDEVSMICRTSRHGAEIIVGRIFFGVAICFFVGIIALGINFSEELLATEVNFRIGFCIGSFVITVFIFFISACFSGIYAEAKYRVFIKTQCNRLYYCDVKRREVAVSTRMNKIGRLIEENENAKERRSINKSVETYMQSEKFVNDLIPLLMGGRERVIELIGQILCDALFF